MVMHTDPTTRVDVVSSASSSSSSDTTTVNALYLQPALLAMYASGAHFAALDASALVLPAIAYGGAPASTWVSYGLEAQVGFRF